MLKPIIWTVISAVAIILTFMSTYSGIWAWVIIFMAIACAAIQWIVWYKQKKGEIPGSNPRLK